MLRTELDYLVPTSSPLSISPGRVMRSAQRLTYWIVRSGLRLVPHNVTVEFEPGDLKPGFRYVLAANHQSMADPFIICSMLPYPIWSRLRTFRFFAHNGLFEPPFLRHALLLLGSFPASNHRRYASGIYAAVNFLSHGQTVVIFPQGRRMAEKGKARSGVKVLAGLPNVAVIPARIEWQRQGRWRRSFRLVVGRPMYEARLSAQQILNRIYQLPAE